MTLNSLEIGEVAKVIAIDKSSNLYQRFLDIGITEDTTIECVLKSPWNNPKAYRIKGATIAIRNDDASAISVLLDEGGRHE